MPTEKNEAQRKQRQPNSRDNRFLRCATHLIPSSDPEAYLCITSVDRFNEKRVSHSLEQPAQSVGPSDLLKKSVVWDSLWNLDARYDIGPQYRQPSS